VTVYYTEPFLAGRWQQMPEFGQNNLGFNNESFSSAPFTQPPITGTIVEAGDTIAGLIQSVDAINGTLFEAGDTLSGTILTGNVFAGAIVEAGDVLDGTIIQVVPGAFTGALVEAGDVLHGIIISISSIVPDPRYTITPSPTVQIGSDILRFEPVTPADMPLLSVDFSYLLPPGVTILGGAVSIMVAPTSLVPDALASSRLSGGALLNGNYLMQFFATGVDWTSYFLTFEAILSNNETISVTAELTVVPYQLF
jgi:hypothetical protein